MSSAQPPPGCLRAPSSRRPPGRRHSRGQSLVEFALTLPVLLLLLAGGIDFGRVFLGWVSLNNTARIAANYAASNAQLMAAGNAAALASYNDLVQQDATATNCQPPDPIPAPTFAPNAGLGGSARVELTCSFQVITPIISAVLGNQVTVGASAVFPVRVGVVATSSGGGTPAPVAAFTVTPSSGDAPLSVTFTDGSTGSPTSYAWDYENDGVIDSTDPNPPDHVYGAPGTFTAVLTVSNGLATSTATRTITVTAPSGPVANFSADPTTGTAPLTVSFTDLSTGTIASWSWDLDGDGTADSTAQNPPDQTYAAGSWDVTLTVTDDVGATSTITRTITVAAANPMCTVPNYKNQQSDNNIQQQWTDAGFDTAVIFNPSRPPEYKISKQSLSAGSQQPCQGTVITVFDK
jgi:PKD repeat protein